MQQITHILDRVAALTSIADIKVLEHSLVKTLSEQIGTRRLSLCRLDTDSRIISEILCGENEDSLTIDLDLGPILRLARHNARFVDEPRPEGYVSIFPVTGVEDVVSYLAVLTPQPLGSLQHSIINGMLRIYHNFLTLIEDSQQDKLTGLLNRRTFDASIANILGAVRKTRSIDLFPESRRGGTHDQTYWLAVIDIDFFKRINDSFGHLYGDEVLILMADIMRRTFRGDDLLFRFGGEEFVVVAGAPSSAEAHAAFERLRRNVEKYEFPQVGQVTVSVGVIAIGANPIASQIIGCADQALYYAKRNGRNQVRFYEDLVAAGEISGRTEEGSIELF